LKHFAYFSLCLQLNNLKNIISIFWLCFALLPFSVVFAQPAYNLCSQALEICPNNTFQFNNIGANKTVCNDCEDDFSFCFSPINTIWLKFNANALGGDVQVDFSNLVFQNGAGQDNELHATLIETSQSCTSNAYTQIGNCALNETGNFSLTAPIILPNTTYFIVLSGDLNGTGITKAAEFSGDVIISGNGVNLPPPLIGTFTDSQTICKNQLVSIGVSIQNCPDSSDYQWFVNNTFVASTTEAFYQTSDLNSGDVVTVTTTCYTKCIEIISASTPSFDIDFFEVNAGPDASLQKGQGIQLQGSGTADSYVWNPSYSLTISTLLNPIALPQETTIYTLSGTKNGCTLFDQVTINIDKDLVVPERFSPNDDGVNDIFEIVGIEQYPNCFLRIYDRWGQVIYQKIAYTYENAWNGTGITRGVSPGVYFYVLELRDDSQQVIKGTITVIR